VTLSSTVTSGAGVPTGTVTFRDGATALGTVTLVNGSASLITSTLAVGTHPLTATYNGSAAFTASTSPTVTHTVVNNNNTPATTTSLTASASTIRSANFITFTATVSPVPPAVGTPTGTVSFFDGTTLIATVPMSSGQATLITRRLQTVGSHSITAVYNGSAGFLGSTSPAVIVTVTP